MTASLPSLEPFPSVEDLIDRARALGPALAERTDQTERDGRVSEELTGFVKAASLHRLMQPRAFGGYGYGPSAVFKVCFEMARACSSTSWCNMVANSNAWFASYWPLEVQQEVWGKDPSAMIVISGIPVGKGRKVDGGYEIWGAWPWASNCDNCDWAIVSSAIAESEGGAPETQWFIVPMADLQIDHDSWNMAGMQGTGSKTLIRKEPLFVRETYRVKLAQVMQDATPGRSIPGNTVSFYNFGTLTGVTYVLRYEDIQPLLTDSRVIGGGRALFDSQNVPPGPLPDWFHSIMFSNEGLAHHRMRLLVQKAFTPRAIEGLREKAAALVEQRLTLIRAVGSGDLMAALADLPMQMMCALIGAPPEDAPKLIAWVNDLGPIFGQMTPQQVAAASDAISHMLDYSLALRQQRQNTPANDLMSELIAAEQDGDRLTPTETAALVANLIIGGYDTTVSQIGCTMLTMLRHPEAMDDVNANPDILDSVVSECFRYETGVPLTWREVVEPFEIAGVPCPKGSVLFINMMTANRDPTAWTDVESFKPRRFLDRQTERLIAFGGGMHHCLGSWLARMTVGEVIRGVSALRPTLSVDPAELEWEQVLGQNPRRLPVSV